MANIQRYYPRVDDVKDAHEAIKQLHDHVYDLRSRLDGHDQKLNSHDQRIEQTDKKAQAADRKASAFTLDLAGIKINAVTDTAGLQNGWSPKFNSSTGMFEFGP